MSEDAGLHYYDENWPDAQEYTSVKALTLIRQINEATAGWPHWVESLGAEVDLAHKSENIYKIDGVWYRYDPPKDSDFKKYALGGSPTLGELIQEGLFVQVERPA